MGGGEDVFGGPEKDVKVILYWFATGAEHVETQRGGRHLSRRQRIGVGDAGPQELDLFAGRESGRRSCPLAEKASRNR